MATHIEKRRSISNTRENKETVLTSKHNPIKKIGFVLGPLLFILTMLLVQPVDLGFEARAVLAGTLWIATWWITEAIPIPITSLLPLVIFPLTGAMSSKEVAASYGANTIFLFMGGFMLALAMEKWSLHRRVALSILTFVGTSANRLVLGFMLATGILSMWISNTAAAMMMVPIGLAIINSVSDKFGEKNKNDEDNFKKALMLGIAFSASIGGVGTLIGTPPNIIFAGIVKQMYGIDISFAKWMSFGIPISIIMTAVTWFILLKVVFPINTKELPGGKEIIKAEKNSIGNITYEEKMVAIVFILTAILWTTRPLLNMYIPTLNDTIIAIGAGAILFILPTKSDEQKSILDMETLKEMPWGILLLFGGGIAIANGFMNSGLAEWIITKLTILDGVNLVLVLLILATIVKFLTELTSNTASATMLLPIMASLALGIGVHPYSLMVTATLSASMAFMLPVGTPPNAIVFGSNYIKIGDMVKSGLIINLISIILIVFAVYFLLPIIWGIDLGTFPAMFK